MAFPPDPLQFSERPRDIAESFIEAAETTRRMLGGMKPLGVDERREELARAYLALSDELAEAKQKNERLTARCKEDSEDALRYLAALDAVESRFDAYTATDVRDGYQGACAEALSIVRAALNPQDEAA